MNLKNQLFSSESVSEGHPDKLCDRISDKILDFFLSKDEDARVACETMASHKKVVISAEINSKFARLIKDEKSLNEEIKKNIKDVILDTGYNKQWKYDPDEIEYDINLTAQSQDISQGVDKGGAGDQGIMFGYASDETPEYMPFALVYANKILLKLKELREKKLIEDVGPDAKSQITVFYDENGIPKEIKSVVFSVQHSQRVVKNGSVSDEFRKMLYEKIIKPVCGNYLDRIDEKEIFINPTGLFLNGGPVADTGLTGRKIIVDTYGGMVPHGGGAFSGKDPTKVDRSAAYMARYVAKNMVAEGLCKKCLIQVAYSIGVEKPLSIMVNSFGTAKISDEKLVEIVNENFDFRPKAIIEFLNLKRPIYYQTAAYGHFGRKEFPWEIVRGVKAGNKEIKKASSLI